MSRLPIYILIFILVLGFSSGVSADENSLDELNGEDLTDMSLEELMEVEIFSSARRPQSISQASRAVYIITGEEIRQAGPVRLEDIFRLVPGMDVFQTEGLVSQVGSRGYTKWNNERMQILLDGRPLYDPYLGGALFYLHPIFAENIERIEVIRGSAGVTWGVNAMNGLINIITKKTADTQRGLVAGGISLHSPHLRQGLLRYGSGVDGPLSWRATIGDFSNNGFAYSNGERVDDNYDAFQATLRGELKLADDETVIFTGGHQNASSNNEELRYLNLLWEKLLDDDSTLNLRWSESCIARSDKHNYFSGSNNDLFTLVDTHSREEMFELQHNLKHEQHNIVWGADYTRDIYTSSPKNDQDNTIPDNFVNDQCSAFVEDEITLSDNQWFTIGYRGYYNELTHFDWAASMSLVWELVPNHFLRGAVSRSFRRPTMWQEFRAGPLKYDGFRINGEGNDSLDNERMVSYEIGYRGQLRENLSINVEGYLNKDKDMMALNKALVQESQPWLPGSDWVETDWYDKWNNVYDVTTYGIETSIDWKPANWWLLRGFHAYIHQTDRNKLTNWRTGETGIILSPKHRVGLTNRFYLDKSTTLNTQLYWTDTATPYYEYIPGDPFWRLDVRLSRRFCNDQAEFAVGATNLLDKYHYEGGYDWGAGEYNEAPRQYYMQLSYSF
ncbi:MAG: TonB-dependent receptor [Sedimentisphaerales bacterium]|nr:TonB-dependent receptor [Sedimentisphaerales bacterium]